MSLCGAIFAGLRAVLPFFNSWPSALFTRDFSNLWLGGKLALEGRVDIIYDLAAFRDATFEILGVNFLNNYSYPPHSLLLAAPFGAMPYWLALSVWNVGSLALFYLAARPLIPKELPWWVVVFSPASLMCLVWGHYGLVCGALWLWSFRGHGAAAALLTIKPHLGLLVAVQLLRDRRGLLVSIVGAAAFVALSIAAFGIAPWRDWLTTTFSYQVQLLDGHRPAMFTTSVAPVIVYGLAGQAIFAVAAILLLTRNFNVFTAATATFLILPYGFHYDLTVVCFGFVLLLATQWRDLTTTSRCIAFLAYLTPALVTLGSWMAPPILLAGLWVQVRYLIMTEGATNSIPDAAANRRAALR